MFYGKGLYSHSLTHDTVQCQCRNVLITPQTNVSDEFGREATRWAKIRLLLTPAVILFLEQHSKTGSNYRPYIHTRSG